MVGYSIRTGRAGPRIRLSLPCQRFNQANSNTCMGRPLACVRRGGFPSGFRTARCRSGASSRRAARLRPLGWRAALIIALSSQADLRQLAGEPVGLATGRRAAQEGGVVGGDDRAAGEGGGALMALRSSRTLPGQGWASSGAPASADRVRGRPPASVEVLGQRRDVGQALAQLAAGRGSPRRQEQVLAEAAVGDHSGEVLVWRRGCARPPAPACRRPG